MNLPIRNRKKVVAARATEQGIAGHQSAMRALGNASLAGNPKLTESYWDGSTGSYSSALTHVPPRSVNIVGSPEQKTSEQARKGRITQGEHLQENAELYINRLTDKENQENM